MLNRKTRIVAALTLLGCSFATQADWQLDAAASSLYYVTSKASAVSEVNTFTGLDGGISEEGTATLTIDLASVDTGIEIRNQRMRELVFQTGQFPSAIVTLAVDTAALARLPAGATLAGSYTATVELHGMSRQVDTDLQIIKLDATTLQVQSAKPLLLGAGLFGLAEGVEQLRELAGLPSINPNVAVTFTLNYKNR